MRTPPEGLWANVWQGALTGKWIGVIRRGDDPRGLATEIEDTEAECRRKVALAIGHLQRQEVEARAREEEKRHA